MITRNYLFSTRTAVHTTAKWYIETRGNIMQETVAANEQCPQWKKVLKKFRWPIWFFAKRHNYFYWCPY